MASRFWVGGTGTWDAATTTHWSDSSGGAGGFSVPGVADTVTLDGSSGGGTVTLNFGGTITVVSLTMGAFTGTFENSTNNNNVTVSGSGNALSISGTATRTINFGTATYTLSSNGGTFTASAVVNLTFSGASSTIAYTGNGVRSFVGGGLTYGTVTIGAAVSNLNPFTITGTSNTIATLNVTGPNNIYFPNAGTTNITDINCNGSSSAQILLQGDNVTASTIATTGSIGSWTGLWGLVFTGSPTATNSFDFGANSGITITAPAGAGGGASFSAAFF